MTNHTPNTVGIDISKAHLDAHQLPSGRSARFANDATGFETLTVWIGSGVERLVYESTGPWHRAFEEALAGTLPLSRVNAKRARRFAQALGQEAKTDAVDARVLARMGAAFDLRRVDLASPTQRDLDELQTARDALVKDRTAASNRKKHARHKLLKRQLRNRLAQIDRQIKALDAEVAKLIAGDKVLTRKAEVLTSVPGIGSVTAAGLLSKMPELGTIDGKAAASLAGLAPMTRESGTWKGGGGASSVAVGPGRGACSTWRRSARSATTRTSFASTVNSVNEASRRRWPSRRSCARCWCWPTPCLGTIGSGRRRPSVRRVACRRERLAECRWSWSLGEGSVSDRSQGSRTNGTPISRRDARRRRATPVDTNPSSPPRRQNTNPGGERRYAETQYLQHGYCWN